MRPTANENLVLDFGFVRLELGGNVFHDFGNATEALNNNGLDDGDGYFAGVTLLLYNGDGTPYLRESGDQATATTDLNGNYLFTGLPEGTFIVEIPASNFAGSQPLRNIGSSDGNDVTPNVAPGPDNDLSGEDNGNSVSGQPVRRRRGAFGSRDPDRRRRAHRATRLPAPARPTRTPTAPWTSASGSSRTSWSSGTRSGSTPTRTASTTGGPSTRFPTACASSCGTPTRTRSTASR